eukprot:665331-Karenia_brevis.AAC.1
MLAATFKERSGFSEKHGLDAKCRGMVESAPDEVVDKIIEKGLSNRVRNNSAYEEKPASSNGCELSSRKLSKIKVAMTAGSK